MHFSWTFLKIICAYGPKGCLCREHFRVCAVRVCTVCYFFMTLVLLLFFISFAPFLPHYFFQYIPSAPGGVKLDIGQVAEFRAPFNIKEEKKCVYKSESVCPGTIGCFSKEQFDILGNVIISHLHLSCGAQLSIDQHVTWKSGKRLTHQKYKNTKYKQEEKSIYSI